MRGERTPVRRGCRPSGSPGWRPRTRHQSSRRARAASPRPSRPWRTGRARGGLPCTPGTRSRPSGMLRSRSSPDSQP
eukprot:776025-Prymnesium_polylepis.1